MSKLSFFCTTTVPSLHPQPHLARQFLHLCFPIEHSIIVRAKVAGKYVREVKEGSKKQRGIFKLYNAKSNAGNIFESKIQSKKIAIKKKRCWRRMKEKRTKDFSNNILQKPFLGSQICSAAKKYYFLASCKELLMRAES